MARAYGADTYLVLRAQNLAHAARLRWGAVILSVAMVKLQSPAPASIFLAYMIGVWMATYNLPLMFARRYSLRWVTPAAIASIAGDFIGCTAWVMLTLNDPTATTYVIYLLVALEVSVMFRWKGTFAFLAAFLPVFAFAYYVRTTTFHFPYQIGHHFFRSGIVVLLACFTGSITHASQVLRARAESAAAAARREALRLEVVYSVGQRANASLRSQEVLEAAVDSLGSLFPHRWFGIMLLDESGDLDLAAGRGEPKRLSVRLPSGRSDNFKSTVVFDDLWNDAYLASAGIKLPNSLKEYKSGVATPLGARDVHFGALVSLDAKPAAFDSDDVKLIEALGPQISTALENARLYEQVEQLSLTDPLTGLGNRRAFDRRLQEEVDRARRSGQPVSLALVDIDHFKICNDTHGHPAGDEVLRPLGEAISTHMIRRTDLAFRYGGDEFAVIMPATGNTEALVAMNRIHDMVRLEPLPKGDHQPGGRFTISIGVTSCDETKTTAQEIIDQADLALFAAKQSGRNRSVMYDSELATSLTHWTRVLPTLMEERAFQSIYQPIVRLGDGALIGYEALARPSDQLAIASVEGMFSAAQRMGWLLDLDWFCFRSAIEFASPLPAGTDLFVNITLTGLLDPTRDPDRLELVLRSERRSVSDIVLEINEREAVTDIGRLKQIVAAYRAVGFRFALDDVGEGHSTFEVLAAIQPEFIKVARTMVVGINDPGARGAIRGMVEFAKTIGATVIAEGIEDTQVTAQMLELGVEVGQGYGLGRPAPLPVESWPAPKVVAS